MKYRLHPDLASSALTDGGLELRDHSGATRSFTGAEAAILHSVAEGISPLDAAAGRWDAPADLIAAGIQKLTESLAERHLIVDARSQDVPTVQLAPPKDRFGVLFVCTANICRSAYAAAYARGRSDGTIHFSSAGTHALVGQEMDPPMAAHLKQAGLDTTHRSRQLNRSVASHADLIITLTGEQRDYILDEWPELARRTFVIGQATRELQELPDGLGTDEVPGYLWSHRSHDPADSVIDPYGQGDDAAARTAREIEEHVDRILEALSRVEDRGTTT